MSKTIRKDPTDKPKRKYKRDRKPVRVMLRSTMDTNFSEDIQQYEVLAHQLSVENSELGINY